MGLQSNMWLSKMKLIIEYGKGKNLITVNGVESISQLPFGLLITFTDNETYTLDTEKLHSMEILPND